MTRYKRHNDLKANALIVVWILILCPLLAKGATTKPNVLFIAVDDLRPQLGCYGQDQIKSPHIDKLASSGTVFRRAYCQVAVCGASRASLLTGLRPTSKRFLNYLTYAEKDAPGAMTLPEEFRKHGYHCISNGKIFHHKNDTANRSWSEPAWRPSIGGADTLNPESNKLIGGTKNRGPVFEAADVSDSAYPSLCDLAGIKAVNKGLQGTSFKPLLSTPGQSWKKAAFSKFGPAVSVITERYNYAEFKNGDRMLFDLKTDPDENVNIAEDGEHQDLVKELSERLRLNEWHLEKETLR